jgi:putative nucleotidyltransferase with HDIG domain
MIERLSTYLEQRFRIPKEKGMRILQRSVIAGAAFFFVLVSSFLVAFDSIFTTGNTITPFTEDSPSPQLAPRDFFAPPNGGSYISEFLTEARREEARNGVQPSYYPADGDINRQQGQILQQTFDYIDDVRAAGRYDSRAQQQSDLAHITTLNLTEDNALNLLQLDEESWTVIQTEADAVLSRVNRQEIRGNQVSNVISNLDIQVNSLFNANQRGLIVDFLDDLILPNSFENMEATNANREAAAAAVEPVRRNFAGGQIIVRENEVIQPEDYEALVAFNLLQPDDFRLQQITRALIASMATMVIIGLYMARFTSYLLYHEPRQLSLIAMIFLLMLALVRFFGVHGDIYLFPSAALAMLFVAMGGAHIAIITALGMAFLTGLMAGDSLQITVFIAGGSLIGTLGLRRPERLNQFFFAGALVGTINAATVIVFNLTNPAEATDGLVIPLFYSVFSGAILVPASAIAAMFIVTSLFNIPTPLKLIDLQQPNKPLLQRLLREAPGTYQHSLQVGNLAEQAANAIGADAQLTHVAALYHDIGKMHSPLYFTENQQDIGNPHDTLNDPYRSADIIISHVTEGIEMAKQSGLPKRIRDFIQEHHGTTYVYVFYQRALNAVDGDESAVDINDFTYPGPKPRSKETALLMLADSCEAAVRSVKPQSKSEIGELVAKIIDSKRAEGQLDDSGLTLKDLKIVKTIFVEILQGMFHPRINYREAIAKKTDTSPKPLPKVKPKAEAALANGTVKDEVKSKPPTVSKTPTVEIPRPSRSTATTTRELNIADEEPMTEVPRLPSLDERKTTGTFRSIRADDAENHKPEDA